MLTCSEWYVAEERLRDLRIAEEEIIALNDIHSDFGLDFEELEEFIQDGDAVDALKEMNDHWDEEDDVEQLLWLEGERKDVQDNIDEIVRRD